MASCSAIRPHARLWRHMARKEGWLSDLPRYALTPTVRHRPLRLLVPSTAMACRMLVTGKRGEYNTEFAMVRTSLENAGSEEIRSLSWRIGTLSLLADCSTRMAT